MKDFLREARADAVEKFILAEESKGRLYLSDHEENIDGASWERLCRDTGLNREDAEEAVNLLVAKGRLCITGEADGVAVGTVT